MQQKRLKTLFLNEKDIPSKPIVFCTMILSASTGITVLFDENKEIIAKLSKEVNYIIEPFNK